MKLFYKFFVLVGLFIFFAVVLPTNYLLTSRAHVTVNDPITIEITGQTSVTEGNTGTNTRLEFVVRLNEASAVDINFSCSMNGVTINSDLNTPEIDVQANQQCDFTVPAGIASISIPFTVTGDIRQELDENLTIYVFNSQPPYQSAFFATEIVNDDLLPEFEIGVNKQFASYMAGQTIRYSAFITNIGTGSANNVLVSFNPPFIYCCGESYSPDLVVTNKSSGLTCVNNVGSLTCNIAILPSQSSISINFEISTHADDLTKYLDVQFGVSEENGVANGFYSDSVSLSTLSPPIDKTVGLGDANTCADTEIQAEVNAASSGDTITFNCGASPIKILVNQEIKVNKSLILNGADKVTLTAKCNSQTNTPCFTNTTTSPIVATAPFATRLLTISKDVNVDVTGINFEVGEADKGGAIYVGANSRLTVTQSSFTNNIANANPSIGGAIYADIGACVKLTTVNFVNNIADNFGGAGKFGSCNITPPTTEPVVNSIDNDGGNIEVKRDAPQTPPLTIFAFPKNIFNDVVNIIVEVEPNGKVKLPDGNQEVYRYEVRAEYVKTGIAASVNGVYQVCIYYRDEDIAGLKEENIKLYYLNESVSPARFDLEPSSQVFPAENKVCANPNHFSFWALFAPPNSTSGPVSPPGSLPTPIPQPTLPPSEDEADFSLSANESPSAPSSGQTFGLVFSVGLKGERNASSALLKATLPAGLEFVSFDNLHLQNTTLETGRRQTNTDELGQATTCTYDAGKRYVECNIGIVSQTQAANVRINVRASTTGSYRYTAEVVALDTRVIDAPGNNTIQRTINISASGANTSATATTTPIVTSVPLLPTITPTPTKSPPNKVFIPFVPVLSTEN